MGWENTATHQHTRAHAITFTHKYCAFKEENGEENRWTKVMIRRRKL